MEERPGVGVVLVEVGVFGGEGKKRGGETYRKQKPIRLRNSGMRC